MVGLKMNKKNNKSQHFASDSYPAAPVVYEVTQKEYEAELERSSKLDNKIGITLAVFGVFSLYAVNFFNISAICDIVSTPDTAFANIKCLCIALQVLIIILYLISIVLLLFTAKATKYYHFNCDYFIDTEQRFRATDMSNLETKIAIRYIGATIKNTETNDQRAKQYNAGSLCLGMLLVLCIIVELLRINYLGLGV